MSTTRLTALAVCALLAGCASLPEDRGRGATTALLDARGVATPGLADPGRASTLLAEIGDQALTVDDAVRLALVGNPALQARFAELGFAAGEVYDAGRLSNPRLGLGYLFVERGSAQDEKFLGITQRFTELVMLPARKRLAEAEFVRVQHAVAGAVQLLANDVAHAWYALAGATEAAAMQREIARTARAATELTSRYVDAGNLGRRELAEARAGDVTAELAALDADDAVAAARARLAQLLGLSAPARGWHIATGLPLPDATDPPLEALIRIADRDRLDLLAARQAVAVSADALGVTRRFRYLGDIEAGPEWQWDDSGMRKTGPVVALEVPVFNQGSGKVARAEAELALHEAELAALEVQIVAELERATSAVANARTRFERHRDQLLPARREIVARRQEDVNFMLTGPFELLAARQDEHRAGQGMLEALARYWLARVELAKSAGQAPPTGSGVLTAERLLTAESHTDPHPPAPAAAPDPTPREPMPDAPRPQTHHHHPGAES